MKSCIAIALVERWTILTVFSLKRLFYQTSGLSCLTTMVMKRGIGRYL